MHGTPKFGKDTEPEAVGRQFEPCPTGGLPPAAPAWRHPRGEAGDAVSEQSWFNNGAAIKRGVPGRGGGSHWKAGVPAGGLG